MKIAEIITTLLHKPSSNESLCYALLEGRLACPAYILVHVKHPCIMKYHELPNHTSGL